MLMGSLAIAAAMLCFFVMGAAVNLGSTCAVAAAQDWVVRRRAGMLIGFGVAIAAAGALILPAKWILAGQVHLPDNPTITVALVLGAAMMGVGAVINGACLFGTLGWLGRGHLRFLGLPVGLALGFWVEQQQSWFRPPAQTANQLAQFSLMGMGVLLVFIALLLMCWRTLRKREETEPKLTYWTYRHSMLLVGLSGAASYALVPGSTYVDAIQLAEQQNYKMAFITAFIGAAAALTGAVVAGIWSKRFVLQVPNIAGFARSVAGGVLMAIGGSWIPGGNDTLLLSYLPGATTGGIVAYVIMTATVFALLLVQSRLRW